MNYVVKLNDFHLSEICIITLCLYYLWTLGQVLGMERYLGQVVYVQSSYYYFSTLGGRPKAKTGYTLQDNRQSP